MQDGDQRGVRDALITRAIAGKPVVLFEKHHYALLPWNDWASDLAVPPRLLSIDYHTDSHPAFLGLGCAEAGGVGRSEAADRCSVRRLAQLNRADPLSVEAAVRDLRYDEHIDAALQAGILDIAFLVSREQQGYLRADEQIALDRQWEKLDPVERLIRINERPFAAPPYSYTLPDNRLVILDDRDAWHDPASERAWRDGVLESRFLAGRLALIDRICTTAGVPRLFEMPFILDIDLDAFNTRQAIAPADPVVFYDLVRRAVGITIAQEPGCVDSCQLDGEGLTAAWLEPRLLAHLKTALDA